MKEGGEKNWSRVGAGCGWAMCAERAGLSLFGRIHHHQHPHYRPRQSPAPSPPSPPPPFFLLPLLPVTVVVEEGVVVFDDDHWNNSGRSIHRR